MRYDFDSVIDRSGTASIKWDIRTPAEAENGFLPLSVADMEFKSPPCVIKALEEAAKQGIYGYTHPDEAFFRACRWWFSKRHGFDCEDSAIVLLPGVVPGLNYAVRAYTQPGESVIVMTPVYPPFMGVVNDCGRTLEEVPLVNRESEYSIDFEALENAAKRPENKLLLFCSPHNPVGRVWTKTELEKVIGICRANGVTLVSDEIHYDLVTDGEHTAMLELDSDAVLLTAPSKTFNVPGLGLAMAVIPNGDLRKPFGDTVARAGGYNFSLFGGRAAKAAFSPEGADWLDAVLRYIKENYLALKAFLETELPDIKVSPMQGTYLAWLDLSALRLSCGELEKLLKEKCLISAVPGTAFGKPGEGFARLNLALPRAELMKALERLKDGIRGLCHE
ncbi:MAG: pyridoxal phosphate-dependent aminotransferase [Clostridiales bacterium]|nr:pyridoxal phosphate-dependent aminotransferase [Clostridiales bacterium]